MSQDGERPPESSRPESSRVEALLEARARGLREEPLGRGASGRLFERLERERRLESPNRGWRLLVGAVAAAAAVLLTLRLADPGTSLRADAPALELALLDEGGRELGSGAAVARGEALELGPLERALVELLPDAAGFVYVYRCGPDGALRPAFEQSLEPGEALVFPLELAGAEAERGGPLALIFVTSQAALLEAERARHVPARLTGQLPRGTALEGLRSRLEQRLRCTVLVRELRFGP